MLRLETELKKAGIVDTRKKKLISQSMSDRVIMARIRREIKEQKDGDNSMPMRPS